MNGNDSRYYRLTNILVPLAVTIFGIFRVLNALALEPHKHREAIIAGSFNTIAVISIILIRRFNKSISRAFWEPMLLYLAYTTAAIAMRDFTFFFNVALAICSIAALYLNSKKLLQYILVSSLITGLLILFKIPMQNPARLVPVSEVLVRLVILLIGSLFIYLVSIIASDKMKKSVNAEDYLSGLLAATPNRVAMLDPLNRVTYISKAFGRMARLRDPQMAVGRPVLDLFHDTSFKDMFVDILKRDGHYETVREVMLDGQPRHFRIITERLNNETVGRHINMVDITPEMTAKFEAEKASKSKSAFLATMSHEIRTPLNAIIGLSEIELQKKLPETTRADLEKIYNSGSNLLAIINDILDISKIEAGNFELVSEPYDVPGLINDTVQLNIVRIGSKPITFELFIDETIPARLYGDELRVKQILNNLLSNAFKYTDQGMVTLWIDCEREGDGLWLILAVSDTGHGIKEEDLGRLFSEYAQLDTRANRHIEGTGLGLPIAKNMVELMGGTITVESEYGRGSVFTARIRQGIVDSTPIGRETAKNIRLYRFVEKNRPRDRNLIRSHMPYGRVLIVDDVETNLDVARGLMLPYGLGIDCASSGREAIEKIRAAGDDPGVKKYDMVFMDHMMPEMDGIEAVRIIRNEIGSGYARDVPIVALTANALKGNEDMFLSSGFNAYITKPIDIFQLDTALNTWIRNKQSAETLKQAESEKAARAENRGPPQPGLFDGLYAEGVDLAAGKERYTHDGVFLDIIRSYCVHTPALLEKIRGFSEGALDQYTVTVHGLKGSSYGICADEAGRYAETLERAARAGDTGTIRAKNGEFINMVETLLGGLNGMLAKVEEGRGERQRAAAPARALLVKLLEACKRYRPALMEEAVLELEKYDYDSGGELVSWLREQLDNLEYDAIKNRLESQDGF